jgi:hypothetical protein
LTLGSEPPRLPCCPAGEDDLRDCERAGDFGVRFVELARSVYRHNDRRAALKARVNELLGSRLREEKSYAPYPGDGAAE